MSNRKSKRGADENFSDGNMTARPKVQTRTAGAKTAHDPHAENGPRNDTDNDGIVIGQDLHVIDGLQIEPIVEQPAVTPIVAGNNGVNVGENNNPIVAGNFVHGIDGNNDPIGNANVDSNGSGNAPQNIGPVTGGNAAVNVGPVIAGNFVGNVDHNGGPNLTGNRGPNIGENGAGNTDPSADGNAAENINLHGGPNVTGNVGQGVGGVDGLGVNAGANVGINFDCAAAAAGAAAAAAAPMLPGDSHNMSTFFPMALSMNKNGVGTRGGQRPLYSGVGDGSTGQQFGGDDSTGPYRGGLYGLAATIDSRGNQYYTRPLFVMAGPGRSLRLTRFRLTRQDH
jgi:hypothetical protein